MTSTLSLAGMLLSKIKRPAAGFIDYFAKHIYACNQIKWCMCAYNSRVDQALTQKKMQFELIGCAMPASADKLVGLSDAWEENRVIRRRFQQNVSWLKWPVVPEKKVEKDIEVEEPECHPCCTKSLELNIDAITIMVDHLDGDFVNVDDLKLEARSTFFIEFVQRCIS